MEIDFEQNRPSDFIQDYLSTVCINLVQPYTSIDFLFCSTVLVACYVSFDLVSFDWFTNNNDNWVESAIVVLKFTNG